MSDFFLRLAARSLESPRAALPRIASRFATPGLDRSLEVDTQFAASAATEQSPPATAAVASRPHNNGEVRDASPRATGVRHDGPATSWPRSSHIGSHIFAVDAENAARRTGPHTRASDEMSSDAHAGLDAIESRRGVAAFGPERSGQLARAPLATPSAAGQFDPSPEAFGPFASTGQDGTAPTALAPTLRPWDAATNASSDIARVTRPSSEEGPAGLVRTLPDVREHARSRPATPDLARTTPDTPPAPEIHVSIGRIEVRAVMAPVTATPRPRASAVGPALTLEAYLRERQEGSR